MADIEAEQVNHLPGNSFPHSAPPWRQNYVLRDAARVSLNTVTLFLEDAYLSMHGAL